MSGTNSESNTTTKMQPSSYCLDQSIFSLLTRERERGREGSNGELAGRAAAAAGDGLGESKLPHMAPPGKPNHLPWNHLQLEKDDDGGQRMETPFNTKKHPQQEQVPQTHPQEQP